MKGRFFAVGIAALLLAPSATAFAQKMSDSAIRQMMIKESIASYPGNCPCPYNVDRTGRACGGRSAHSRPGGRSPLCYPEDISDQMLGDYKRRKGLS